MAPRALPDMQTARGGADVASEQTASKRKGTWRLVTMECQGRMVPLEDILLLSRPAPSHPLMKFQIGDDLRVRCSYGMGKEREVCSLLLDSTGSSTAIDLVRDTGILKGVLKLKDGHLEVCLNVYPGLARPSNFSSHKGDSHLRLVYRREEFLRHSSESAATEQVDARKAGEMALVPNREVPVIFDDLLKRQPETQRLPEISPEQLAELSLASLRELQTSYTDQQNWNSARSKQLARYSQNFRNECSVVAECSETLRAFDRWLEEPSSLFPQLHTKLEEAYKKWAELSGASRNEADRLARIVEDLNARMRALAR